MEGKFEGKRLKQARIFRGLTVADLAMQTGCQRQTLSMYELGKSQPAEKSTIGRLANALKFPVKFFYEKPTEDFGTVYFRSLLTTNKKYRSEQITKIQILSQIYEMLQDYIEFPAFSQPDFPDDISPEEAANALREKWGLGQGPIHDIVSIVEDNGLLVTSFATSSDDVDAFSLYVSAGDTPTYLIAYSSNKTAAARIHFDIAHELGHICLHSWSEDIEELEKSDFKERENQANAFAAAFLLPADTFRKDALSGPHSLVYYKQLKKKWRVSIAAMLRRSRDLDVLTNDEYQTLIRTMQRRGQRKEEPLDDTLTTALPSLLKMSVIMLLQENVFTPPEFMNELSVSYGLSIFPEDIEDLLALPHGTLSSSKIIDITSLQMKNGHR